jgi:hypothetical protein
MGGKRSKEKHTCAGEIPIRLTLLLRRDIGVSLRLVGDESGVLRLPPNVPTNTILSLFSVATFALSAPCSTSPPAFPSSSTSTGAHAIMNTPAKVAAHPYRNVTN